MSADLHNAIRAALQAGDIAATDLRYPELRQRHRPNTRQVFAIAGAIAAVVVLAVALAVTGEHRREDAVAGPNGSLTGVAGYRWRVVRLDDRSGSLRVPAALHARIDFTRDGYVLGDDTVNALQGNYHVTAGGYTVRNAASTLVASAGMSRQRERTVAAVDAMFFSLSGKPGGPAPPPPEVAVYLHHDTLRLSRGTVTLTLHRAGKQPDFFATAPSPTAGKTG